MRVGVTVAVVVLGAGLLTSPPVFASTVPTAFNSVSTSGLPDGGSEPTEAAASQVAVKFGHPVVADSLTTPTEQVSALPDGTFQLTESTVPVRVTKGGEWVPIDTDLSTSKSGYLTPNASTASVEFGSGGDDVLARVQAPGGDWLTETSPFGTLPIPKVDGSTATYQDVLPGVDLQLTATALGMTEVLVIESATAAANPELASVDFGLDAASLKLGAGGVTSATTSDGSKVTATTPTWWDSSDGSNADGPVGNASARPVPQTVGKSAMTIDAQAVATSRGVVYPVFVDPPWTGGLQAYTYVDAAYSTTSYWNGANATGQQRTGFVNAANSPDSRNHTARSLWQVDTSGVAGRHILAAQFSVTEDWSFNCTPSEVDLYWSGGISSGTTWNNQPGQIQLLSSATVAYGYSSACPTSAVGFTAVPAVQAAANINATGLVLELIAANESSNAGWKRFNQSATIMITYNSAPNVPSALTVAVPARACGTSAAPSYLNATQAVKLQASITDADPGNDSATFALSSVGSGGALTPVASYSSPSAPQGTQQITIPSGVLTTGTTYAWDVQAYDGTDTSAYSGYCYFTVKNTNPALPTVTRISAVAATVGASMTFQFGSTTSDHIGVFAYWWSPTGLTSPSPAVPGTPVTTTSAVPACGSAIDLVTFVCPDAGGNSPVITVAPIDDISTLWVASYDAAGNISKNAAGTSSASGFQVTTGGDYANVSFTTGHGWITDALSSPIPSTMVDANTSSGTGLTSQHNLTLPAGTTKTAKGDELASGTLAPVFSFPGFTELDRYYGGPDHASFIESKATSGYALESWLGQLAALVPSGQPQPSGTVEFYECLLTTGDEMTSGSSICEGSPGAIATPLGYAWTSAAVVPAGVGAVAMYRCTISGEHFDSLSTSCEGQHSEGVLGYLATLNPTTTGQVIDTSRSFTVSAWLNPSSGSVNGRTYAAISESGSANSGFALSQSNGVWQFCVSGQTIPATPTCVVGPAVSTNAWTYLTGIYDAVNHQLRLLVGQYTNPVAATPYATPGGSTSVTGSLLIGSGLVGGAPAYQWNGLIDDPTVFQGVVDANQLGNLYYQSAP